MKRIAIFGSAFNPVHRTHLEIAQMVTSCLAIDRLLWVPTGIAWHKSGTLAAASQRVEMLELALAATDTALTKQWGIEPYEIERHEPSYTVQTVDYLQQKYADSEAEWFLIMGSDQFNLLHTWYCWEELVKKVQIVVVERLQVPIHPVSEVLEKTQWMVLPFKQTDDSSTQIRKWTSLLYSNHAVERAEARKQLNACLAAPVLQYIEQNQLYRSE